MGLVGQSEPVLMSHSRSFLLANDGGGNHSGQFESTLFSLYPPYCRLISTLHFYGHEEEIHL
ncbi:hypothetical protein F9C07_11827 [Aspergillus flavus]|uniref:Uncharacterized protein n=1 Tax=Aspergillus flavus (strain ATCC 200026 / FGSC A1120 / IAM 13836 / NRRL 3357 / JCM 12722 / SRRC 167) TaxID=332952 RepID=A0A7U2N2R5_ASPFN|nr:hypothetical protein F9C07_11827 [Aspergillus flavus]